MGGVINLARLAFSVTVWIVAAAGFLLCIAALRKVSAPCSRLLAANRTERTPSGRFEAFSTASFIGGAIMFAIVVIATFIRSLIERYHQAAEYRTILVFAGLARSSLHPSRMMALLAGIRR